MALPTLRQPQKWIIITGAILLTALLSLSGILVWRHTHSRSIPKSITQQLLFPVYRINYLPPGFTLDRSSFQIKDNVLIFQAINAKTGQNIAITESATPQKIDFPSFYQKSLSNVKNLQGQVPYPTVTGKLNTNQRTTISITPPSAWILMTTEANLDQAEIIRIAKGVHLQ